MAGKIFVSYRRDDVRAQAARIYDRVAATFGAGRVFMDVDTLTPGQRFDEALERALADTGVLIAVIGPSWSRLLTVRLQRNERDYVREEIASALHRKIAVIPLLIDQTGLPQDNELPGDLKHLVFHQAHRITHERFGRDTDDLIAAIRIALRSSRVPLFKMPAVRRAGYAVGLLATVALALGISVAAMRIWDVWPTITRVSVGDAAPERPIALPTTGGARLTYGNGKAYSEAEVASARQLGFSITQDRQLPQDGDTSSQPRRNQAQTLLECASGCATSAYCVAFDFQPDGPTCRFSGYRSGSARVAAPGGIVGDKQYVAR